MDYEEAIDWLYSFEKQGIKLGLERIKYLCDKLGNPQNNYKIVHVGGTNGKGSVCRFISSILTSEGYTVGVYTSPHIERFSERFVIDNDEISEIEIILLIDEVKPIVEEMIQKGDTPTFFEVVTAMAFLYFYDKKVDYAIIEVGLGGRFDATNIIEPLASVITNVSLEHQDRLGNTIEDIAFEKAGIIKENTPVVTAAKDSALKVIKKVANGKNASLHLVSPDSWKRTGANVSRQSFIFHGELKDYEVETKISGLYQGENIALAISCIESLQMNGVFITDENIAEGIKKTENPGRMEMVSTKPTILLDGAHNVEGIKNLRKTLENDFEFDRLILVIGILNDKNYVEMLEEIVPICDLIITTKSSNKRSCNPFNLKKEIEYIDYKKSVIPMENINKAVLLSKSKAGLKDIVCICGSLYLVGEARSFLQEIIDF